VELACTARFTNLPIDFFAISSNFGTIAKFAVTRERPAKYEDFSHKVQHRNSHPRVNIYYIL